MKFLDQVKIYVESGSGGSGIVSFRRERNLEFGGPDGGSGGSGGNVWIESINGLNTLIDYSYKKNFYAKNGMKGMSKNRSGKNGQDIVLKVPIGTQILEEDNKTIIYDFTKINQRYCIAKGGNGGFGNLHFTTSINRAPYYCNLGMKGEKRIVWLRLKLIADVGIIGLPNAGKSTFLSKITRAKPKISEYSFTTLHPNLGVASFKDNALVFADIPGIIKNSHKGIGLGHRFLGHIERSFYLLHLISVRENNPVKSYHIIRHELKKYKQELFMKPEIVALSQSDTICEKELYQKFKLLQKEVKSKIFIISSFQENSLKEILNILFQKLKK